METESVHFFGGPMNSATTLNPKPKARLLLEAWADARAADVDGCHALGQAASQGSPKPCLTHRLLCSSFLGLPYRILDINHRKELLRSLWVSYH